VELELNNILLHKHEPPDTQNTFVQTAEENTVPWNHLHGRQFFGVLSHITHLMCCVKMYIFMN